MGAAGLRIRKRRLHRVPRAEARCTVMPATGLRIRKRCLHRVPRGRGRYRTAVAVADTAHAAKSRTVTGCSGANSCATCSSPCSGSGATSASTPSAAASAPAASSTATASQQRAGCCDQQCRYGGYCNKLGYFLHDDLLFVLNSACTAEQRNRRDHVP